MTKVKVTHHKIYNIHYKIEVINSGYYWKADKCNNNYSTVYNVYTRLVRTEIRISS